jgi:hypothetical protein
MLTAISMIITYNEYPSTQNLYNEFYPNRENLIRVTWKWINNVQGSNSIDRNPILMIITHNEYPSTENFYTEFHWNRATQLRITRKSINYVQGQNSAYWEAT